jgi:glycine dehydrogenase
MSALVSTAPGEFGGDVSHLNLHKFFCIPHGGRPRRRPGLRWRTWFCPAITAAICRRERRGCDFSSAPLGSTAVLPISWMYCRMMGPEGLKRATRWQF